MSGTLHPVTPAQANSVLDLEQSASGIEPQPMLYRLVPATQSPQKQSQQNGPLKELIAHQDSLYKYISWEDPVWTLGSFVATLSILFGAHYLPLTQYALKAAATILGVVSVAEFASRSFGPNTVFSRLRPKEYAKVPEPILNATLKDVHDFIQFAIVKVQRIVFGQDLEQTFVAFVGFITVYWLIKIVQPFWLAVLGLTSLYAIPAIWSPRGREVMWDAKDRAGDLTNAAAINGKHLADAAVTNGKALFDNASASGKNLADATVSNSKSLAHDTSNHGKNLAQEGKNNVAELSSNTRGHAVGNTGHHEEVTQSGKYATNDLPTQNNDLVSRTVLPSSNAIHTRSTNNLATQSTLPNIALPAANVARVPDIVQDSYRQAGQSGS